MIHRKINNQIMCTREEFNEVFSEKNNEIAESLIKLEYTYKYNFTISLFKPLLDLNRDEILRDILVKSTNNIRKKITF
jgi:hypothetical protein